APDRSAIPTSGGSPPLLFQISPEAFMPIRRHAVLCAGASVLVLATTAQAQDNHHHHAPRSPQDHSAHADPAGHPPADPHAAHDGDHAMTSSYGPWSMNRDASGTAWQPDMGRHGGVHHQAGDWMVMTHANLNLVHSDQGGPHGGRETFVAGMLMTTARRDFADGSKL